MAVWVPEGSCNVHLTQFFSFLNMHFFLLFSKSLDVRMISP